MSSGLIQRVLCVALASLAFLCTITVCHLPLSRPIAFTADILYLFRSLEPFTLCTFSSAVYTIIDRFTMHGCLLWVLIGDSLVYVFDSEVTSPVSIHVSLSSYAPSVLGH